MSLASPVYITLLLAVAAAAPAQQHATITIDTQRKGAAVAPTLHGVFFEEISHAGEGGLYAELIQNRGFEEANIPQGMTLTDGFIVPPRTPHFSMPRNGVSDWKMEWPVTSEWPAWSSHTQGNAAAQLIRTDQKPLNKATPHSLQITISKADKVNRVAVVNEGFWGINVVAGESYLLNAYMRAANYTGTVTAALLAEDGSVLASHTFTTLPGGAWKKYSAALKAVKSSPKASFVLYYNSPGTVWLDFVSLFPAATFHDRPNGLRKDLAQYIADLKPAFIRWPGGCFVEGITIQSAPDWKQTIGPVEQRTATYSPWGYWCTNGFGYHEYLQYCEDIGAAALYVFNAGVSCDFRSGTFVADDSLQPYIQSALDAIEYAIGPVSSKWGGKRAAAGHPKPFPLKYVEIGNEQNGPRYAQRYNIFYEAITTRYPQVKMMASMGIGDVNEHTLRGMKRVDYADEHAYKAAGWAMHNYHHFDNYKRGNWELYVGEYATNSGVGTGNMEAALNDAVYMLAMEKNGDLVKMSSYAPLLVNENDVDWPVNLIHFNSAASFARISYYAIQLFTSNRADTNLITSVQVAAPAVKKPAFEGGIGLATWDTKTAYKDIEVIHNGATVYKSDFSKDLSAWSLPRGRWEAGDSALVQTADGAQRLALLKQQSWPAYTLKLKARKIAGYNAFIIPFAVKDSNTFYRAHIGAWVNRSSVFEKVTNGYDISNISAAVPLKDTIQPGRWYNIRLEVGTDTVSCYLDDQLLMRYTEPDKLFAIAGKEKNGEGIVKIVNAYSEPVITTLLGWPAAKGATQLLLSAPVLTAENSLSKPAQYKPMASDIAPGKGQPLTVTLQPYSINIIRIKK